MRQCFKTVYTSGMIVDRRMQVTEMEKLDSVGDDVQGILDKAKIN